MAVEKRRVGYPVGSLLKNGQAFSHIFTTHASEIGCSRKTIYNFIEKGALYVKY
jgi:tetrahydromethanopterin S-methyltransferase subunit H